VRADEAEDERRQRQGIKDEELKTKTNGWVVCLSQSQED
jgi:hypothetical protein